MQAAAADAAQASTIQFAVRVHVAAYQNSWAQGWTARGSKKPIKGLIKP